MHTAEAFLSPRAVIFTGPYVIWRVGRTERGRLVILNPAYTIVE